MSYNAKIGTRSYPLSSEDIDALRIEPDQKEGMHVIHKNKSRTIEVLHTDIDKHTVKLRLGGRTITIRIEDELEQMMDRMGFLSTVGHETKELIAPMPGLVLEILVREGDKVKSGDSLLILEAMKMENILKAPADAIVKNIYCKKSGSVEKAQILIEFE